MGCVTLLDQAERWLGTTESGNNRVPGITDRWGIDGQAWCMAAVRTWAADAGLSDLGPGDPRSLACDPTSAEVHQAGNFRQQLTAGKPGDVVIFSWYAWQYRTGVRAPWNQARVYALPIPTIVDGGKYHGLPAGDHVGVLASEFDGAGYWCIEGNTRSDAGGNQGEGDGVYRKWRSITTICCLIPTADRFASFTPQAARPTTPAETAPEEEFEMPDYFYHHGSASSPDGSWYPVYPGGKMRQDMLWDEVNHLVLNLKVPVFHCATPPSPTRFLP